MKVQQLFEAVGFRPNDTVPSHTQKTWIGRFTETAEEGFTYEDIKWRARILLSMIPPINTGGLDENAVKDAYEHAKEKFLKIRKAHSTQLRFKLKADAEKYMKTMEYPGWPMVVQWAGLSQRFERSGGNAYHLVMGIDWEKTRKVKSLDLKKQEFKAPYGPEIFTSELDGDRVKISIDEKTGHKMSSFISLSYSLMKKFKNIYNVKGTSLDYSAMSRSRPQKIWINTTDLDSVNRAIGLWYEKHLGELKRDHDDLQNKLETRKADNKSRAEDQKARKQALYDKYGKDIVERVKVRPMSQEGDDGYQWALFLDGRRRKSGMTQHQADGEQRIMWNWLLKWKNMTPQEQLDHMQSVHGLEAFFAYETMEKSIKSQLPQYLDLIKKNAKGFVDAKDQTKDAIETAKVSDTQAKSIFNSLMQKLRDNR